MSPWKHVLECRRDNQFTPDVPTLDRMEWHYIFVYGSLKKGFPNHDYLEEVDIISRGAHTTGNTC
jgi:hypothetical protein